MLLLLLIHSLMQIRLFLCCLIIFQQHHVSQPSLIRAGLPYLISFPIGLTHFTLLYPALQIFIELQRLMNEALLQVYSRSSIVKSPVPRFS